MIINIKNRIKDYKEKIRQNKEEIIVEAVGYIAGAITFIAIMSVAVMAIFSWYGSLTIIAIILFMGIVG